MESGMPRGGKDKTTEDDVGPLEEAPDGHETFGQALSRAGFEPAKVERRIVSQGRRRETLKKRASEDVDK
jgi:hypothetical protein